MRPVGAPAVAAAGINKTINFQGRLLNNTGAVVADGNYNMRFKIYQDGPGNVAGDTGGTLMWTELWQNSVATGSSAGVAVKNGYFSVNLGSWCAFSGGSCQGNSNTGANWDQDTLWLSVDVGGTAVSNTPSYDGEMLPMRRLASSVYALQAANSDLLGGISSSGFIQNIAPNATQQTANINIVSGAGAGVAAAQIQAVASATAPVLVLKGGATPGSGADLLQLQDSSGAVTDSFNSSGNLTIGRASAVDGRITFDNHSNANTATIYNDGNLHVDGGSNNVWVDGSNLYLNANSHGNVGINTSSPGDVLTVNGNIQVRDADAASRAFRLRTSGTAVDLESGGAQLYLSTWSGSSFSGTQYTQFIFDNAGGDIAAQRSMLFATGADRSIYVQSAASGNNGNNLTIQAGSGTGTSKNGGNLLLQGGNSTSGGTAGSVIVKPQTDSTAAFQVQNAAGTAILGVDTTANQLVSTANLNVGLPSSVGTSGSAGHAFSDGFESGNGLEWTNAGGSGTATFDAATVHSGKFSLKLFTSATNRYIEQQALNSGNGYTTIYGREYFNATSVGNPTYLMDFGTAAMGSGTHMQITLGTGGDVCWTAFTGITAGCTSTVPSTNAWHKLEAELVVANAGGGQLQIWLDNTNIENMISVSTGTTAITNFALGRSVASSATVYYDDVAVDGAATGDGASAYVANDLHVSGGSTFSGQVSLQPAADSALAFQILNSSGAVRILTVDTSGNHVYVGASGSCPSAANQGRFCVGQSVSANGATVVNSLSYMTVSNGAGAGSNVYGQKIQMPDTGTAANSDYPLYVDESGVTNTSATVNSITAIAPAANSGNLIDLQSCSGGSCATVADVLKVSNTGATVFKNQADSTAAFQVQNSASGATILGVDTANAKVTVATTASGGAFINNGATLSTAKNLGNFAANGAIGTAAATVDVYTTFVIPQTTSSISLTVPSPTDTTAGRTTYIANTGSASLTVAGITLSNGSSMNLFWNGTAWTTTSVSTGASIVGTFSGSSQANGASISGNTITFGPADTTNPGMVSTGTQTFGGAKTFQATSTTAFQLQNAGGSSTLLTADTSNLQVTIGGDLVVAKKADAGGTSSDWTSLTGTAGTLCGQTAVDTAKSSAVYNGSLYIGTSEQDKAEVCQYQGGTTWARINSAAGTFGSNSNTDTVGAMSVYNGYLYIGTTGGGASTGADTNKASVYRWDGGTTFTLVNTTQGTFKTQASVDGVSSMVVYEGHLWIGTSESGLAQVLRYDGGTGAAVFTDFSDSPGTFSDGGGAFETGVNTVSAMAVYDYDLYVGLSKPGAGGSGAAVMRLSGPGTTTPWTQDMATTGQFVNDTGIDEIDSMVVYNGAMYVTSAETSGSGSCVNNCATIYRMQHSTADHISNYTQINPTAGTFNSTSAITKAYLGVYGGRLYVGTQKSNSAELYRYDDTQGNGAAGFTKVSQSTAGTLKVSGTTAIDAIDLLMPYNGLLYVGTSESNAAEIYTFNESEGQSNRLLFNASSDNAGSTEQSGFPNQGSIYFNAELGAQNNPQSAATGTFIFSNAISTNTGAYDVAEDYATRDDTLKPGDLVSIDPGEAGFVRKASGRYDPGLVGVYSENPALRLSQADSTINGGKAIPVALAGRVPMSVDTENGAILPGDPLTSSSTPGVAMKATGAGRIVGMAMEPYDGVGVGRVMGFVNPNYYSGVSSLQGDMQSGDLAIDGRLSAQEVSVTGVVSSKDLNVTGTANVATLNVTGTATIGSLMVSGNVSAQSLTVTGEALIQSVTVNGDASVNGNLNLGRAGRQNAITKEFIAGKDLMAGEVVVADPNHDGQVTTTTIAGDTKVVGVALADAKSGIPVKVVIGGTVQVKTVGTVAAGDILASSATEGAAAKQDPPQVGEVVGKALSKQDGNGFVWMLVVLQ